MKRFVGGIGLAALVLAFAATPAAAQLGGQPVYPIMKGTGVSINADFGAGVDPSGYNTLAGRVTLGLPMVGFEAGFEPKVLDNSTSHGGENQIMGGAAVRLLPSPISVRVQGNVGYGLDSKNIAVVGGAVFGLNVPSPVLSVEPFVFPQVRYMHNDATGDSNTDWGGTAGLMVTLPGGLGAHAAIDYDHYSTATTIGIGVHYKLSVPGLGGM